MRLSDGWGDSDPLCPSRCCLALQCFGQFLAPEFDRRLALVVFALADEFLLPEFRGALEVFFSVPEPDAEDLCAIARQFSPEQLYGEPVVVELLLTDQIFGAELGGSGQDFLS